MIDPLVADDGPAMWIVKKMGLIKFTVGLTQAVITQEKYHEIKHKRKRRRQDAPSDRED